ncbi:hypothetical protein JTB14_027539 [Gonioctena quinquepunctata]|nr:hypothetical protein JTB14_027539 [Gonioctena quinquepunctata]
MVYGDYSDSGKSTGNLVRAIDVIRRGSVLPVITQTETASGDNSNSGKSTRNSIRAYVDKDPELQTVRRANRKLQGQRARELMQVAGVSIPEDGAGIPELQQFQKHMNYKIIVYDYGSKGRNVIFEGDGVGPSLNLLTRGITMLLLPLLQHSVVIISAKTVMYPTIVKKNIDVEGHVQDADSRPLVPLRFL